jgi:hypothetical protein
MARGFILALLSLAIAICAAMYLATSEPATAQRPTCGSFPNQAEAQHAYRADPIGLRDLDGNGDGIACESNPCPCDRTPVGREAPLPAPPPTPAMPIPSSPAMPPAAMPAAPPMQPDMEPPAAIAPGDAIAAYLAQDDPSQAYIGACDTAILPDDVDKFCSTLRDERGGVLAYWVRYVGGDGPVIWYFLAEDGQGWHVIATAPVDFADDTLTPPWP